MAAVSKDGPLRPALNPLHLAVIVDEHPQPLGGLGEDGTGLYVVHPMVVRKMEDAADVGGDVRDPVTQGGDLDLLGPLA